MSAVNVPLSDDAREFVEAQAAAGGYESPASYIEDLVRAEQRRQAQERLETLLLEGLNSPSDEVTAESWERFRAELRARPAAEDLAP